MHRTTSAASMTTTTGSRDHGDHTTRIVANPRRPVDLIGHLVCASSLKLIYYDLGTVFRRVRAHADWSQQTLGNLVGLHQAQISVIERDVRRLRDVELVVKVAAGLQIPPFSLVSATRGLPWAMRGVMGGRWRVGWIAETLCSRSSPWPWASPGWPGWMSFEGGSVA